MRHPFDAIPPANRAAVFWPLATSAAVMTGVMQVAGAPLKTAAAPMGIISFELAGNTRQVAAILTSWGPDGQLHAAFSLGIDYLYMVTYAAAVALGCVAARSILHVRGWPLANAGSWLAWGVWLAAACDAIENIALLRLLYGPVTEPWPMLAALCALVKFALIVLGLFYALYGGVAWLMHRVPAGVGLGRG